VDTLLALVTARHCPTVSNPLALNPGEAWSGYQTEAESFVGITALVNMPSSTDAEELRDKIRLFVNECFTTNTSEPDRWWVTEVDDLLDEGWDVPGTVALSTTEVFASADLFQVDTVVALTYLSGNPGSASDSLFAERFDRALRLLAAANGVPTN